ncbi:MAG TPA: pyruvate:ferredoxin (flavodoxin) oxidoreductase, partial [Candidatus Krumholzibacteria bacterium]|nr:pyruvate:ferredoxin (flavodoxin) oxidoreductase [Candidatus Krumholzibacteria bacterium]
FTPAMVKGVLDEAKKEDALRRFTVGIVDDVTHLSLDWDDDFVTEPDDVTRAVFYGLGSDGTVGASKNSVKIIGEETEMYAQGYFVYDSKKAGSTTVSHLRFGPRPIESTYLIRRANFVACHQFNFLEKMDVLETACEGATFLLNSPFSAEEVWDQIPAETQQGIIDKKLKFYVVDGYKVAKEAGMGTRINTVMQTCFFAISGVLPKDDAIARIKEAIRKTYGKRGQAVLDRNFAAVDASLGALSEVKVPGKVNSTIRRHPGVPEIAPDFVQRVTRIMIEGKGDLLPVSAMPVDGTFPTGTTKWEKRSIAQEIPIWDPEICIQCALCSLVCPHAAIRMNAWDPKDRNGDRPEGFLSVPWKTKEHEGLEMAIQVAPDDCTGCGVCVDVCPAHSKKVAKHKAINMEPQRDHLERERANFDYFSSIEYLPRQDVKLDSIKGSQLGEPLFEFSGACAGCGETPYIKLATQLFGDRMIIANATGCSSIYGGNLPTTPYTTNAAGHGPAWNNSLFEDNAEFGIGMRLAVEAQTSFARSLVRKMSARLGGDLAGGLLEGEQKTEAGITAQRARVAELKEMLQGEEDLDARDLLAVADSLVRRSVWIVGGDGWAYDIGFGGLDHVIASGRNVNILVLDTEVYSNTGGQASKATPRAAVAKFAAGGKSLGKKDLGMIAMAYGNCYVAQVALGANPSHTIRVMKEAEAYDGPSLIIAYSHCIAHGIDMSTSMSHQKEGVKSGFISLYHYNPDEAHTEGSTPFKLDSKQPSIPFRDFALKEARFGMLERSKPERAQRLFAVAQSEIEQRYKYYKQLAGVERTLPADEEEDADRLSKEPKE